MGVEIDLAEGRAATNVSLVIATGEPWWFMSTSPIGVLMCSEHHPAAWYFGPTPPMMPGLCPATPVPSVGKSVRAVKAGNHSELGDRICRLQIQRNKDAGFSRWKET